MDGDDELVRLSAPARQDREAAVLLLADAERTARRIDGQWPRTVALIMVAEALTAVDPGRAAEMLDEAEREAQAIHVRSAFDTGSRVFAFQRIAVALAAIDPDRAEVLVKSVSGQSWVPGRTMALVVDALAGSDPERAERMAATIPEEQWRAVALATIGCSSPALDQEDALRLIAEAERVARSTGDLATRAMTLASVGAAMAKQDVARAANLITEAEHHGNMTQGVPVVRMWLTGLVPVPEWAMAGAENLS